MAEEPTDTSSLGDAVDQFQLQAKYGLSAYEYNECIGTSLLSSYTAAFSHTHSHTLTLRHSACDSPGLLA